jgi:uncharacterized protein YcbK (DUF882 family)
MAVDTPNSPARPGLARRTVLAGLAAGAAAFAAPAWAEHERARAIELACPETGERFVGAYWQDGAYLAAAMRRIDWLMRDFHHDVAATIDPALIDLLRRIALAVGGRPVRILSGFRTRETNGWLRREGMPAAVRSQHLVARAADICIDGVEVVRLHHAALRLGGGGVGIYDGFIHVDTGPLRKWSDRHHAHRGASDLAAPGRLG